MQKETGSPLLTPTYLYCHYKPLPPPPPPPAQSQYVNSMLVVNAPLQVTEVIIHKKKTNPKITCIGGTTPTEERQ